MSLLALGAAWTAVATVAGLALAAAVRRNTTRTRRRHHLPLRDPGIALAEARMVDRLQQAINDYETCAALENRTWKENQS